MTRAADVLVKTLTKHVSSPLVMYHFVVEFLAPVVSCLTTDVGGYDCCPAPL